MTTPASPGVPTGVDYRSYCRPDYCFEYPAGGVVVEIDHGDGDIVARLLGRLQGRELQIDIEPWRDDAAAQAAAEGAFKSASDAYADENIAPYQMEGAAFVTWRCIKRFVDGFSAPLVIDSAFIETPSGLFKASFAVEPALYPSARWIFDMLLATFRAGQDV